MWSLRFPDFLVQELGVSRTRWDITFDRKYTTRRSDLQYMNPDNWLFKYWLDISSQYDFKGVCASLANLNNLALIAGIIRWQNIQGKRIRQELVIFDSHSNRANLNPRWVENWLLQAQLEDSKHFCDRHVAEKLFNTVEDAVNTIVRDKMSSNLLPEEPQWIAAGYGN